MYMLRCICLDCEFADYLELLQIMVTVDDGDEAEIEIPQLRFFN